MARSKRIFITVGILLLIGILIQLLFDPLSSVMHSIEIARVRAEFPTAREKWHAQKIRDYRFEISGYAPLICIVSNAMIEVRNDQVVKVELKGLDSGSAASQVLPPDKWSNPDWGEEVFLCDYANFTMTQFFDLIERALQNDPSIILNADFDPDYGFVTSYRYGLFVGQGLLSSRISDCCSGFTISHFEPLQP